MNEPNLYPEQLGILSEREILLRAVCDNPADRAPRFAYRDWLLENGHDEQAEFMGMLRPSIASRYTNKHKDWRTLLFRFSCPMLPTWLHKHTFTYSSDSSNPRVYPHGFPRIDWDVYYAQSTRELKFYVEDGFITSAFMTTQRWLRFGPQLVRTNPIQCVCLLDLQTPYEGPLTGRFDEYYRYWTKRQIGHRLFQHLSGDTAHGEITYPKEVKIYQSSIAARQALSDAAIQWAKNLPWYSGR